MGITHPEFISAVADRYRMFSRSCSALANALVCANEPRPPGANTSPRNVHPPPWPRPLFLGKELVVEAKGENWCGRLLLQWRGWDGWDGVGRVPPIGSLCTLVLQHLPRGFARDVGMALGGFLGGHPCSYGGRGGTL